MDFDFKPYFDKYEQLSAAADKAFEAIKHAHPECVRCEEECADCCHAIFDLTLIEALYLNARFNDRYKGEEREALMEKANLADRTLARLKRKAFNAVQDGVPEDEILERLGAERVRCPLLNEQSLCHLYDHRPITCRLYGVPASIGGKGRTCGLSGFQAGKAYPTVNIDKIHTRLQELSAELLRDIESQNIKLADLLIPVSMSMLADFDDEFLGVRRAGGEGGGETT